MDIKHFIYGFISLLLIFSGCREITVRTTINKDGSFTRQIRITGDSSELYTGNLPYPVDSSWTRELSRDTTDVKKYALTYTRYYGSMDVLSKELDGDSSWISRLNRKTNISKRFGLFYTYLTFSETYPAANPFQKISFSDYLTPQEVAILKGDALLLTKQDSLQKEAADEKMEEYLLHTLAKEVTDVLTDGIRQLDHAGLRPEDIEPYQDSLMRKLSDWNFQSPDEFIGYYSEWSGNPVFDELSKLEPPIFEALNAQMDFFEKILMMQEYTQEVEMPGLLIATNSHTITANRVSWEVKPDLFLLTDYEMTAESRVVNNWAFIGGAFLLLTLLVFLLAKNRR